MFKDNPALLSVLEPGDRIVATMRATERFWVVLGTLVSVVLAAAWFVVVILTHQNFAVAVVLFLVVGGLNLAVWSRQRPCFFAVTERLLVCHGVTWPRGRPTRLLFTAPLSAVSVSVGGRNPLLGIPFRYSGPGVRSDGLNLVVGRRSEEFLGLVLAALRAGGANVTDRSLGQLPDPESTD
jgi:hypothetical protein